MPIDESLYEKIDQLSSAEKWRLVRHVLETLEKERTAPLEVSDWHKELQATYGILADDPIERAVQLPLQERDPIE